MTHRLPHRSAARPQITPMAKAICTRMEKATEISVRDHPIWSVKGLMNTPKNPVEPQVVAIIKKENPVINQEYGVLSGEYPLRLIN